MTALCGGGASEPIPGSASTIYFDVQAVFDFILPAVGEEAAAILAPIIAGIGSIVAGPFCSTDPPADPGLTPAILADATKLPPSLTTLSSIGKVKDWFLHQYWWRICQCTLVATPAPPTPSNPGSVGINPGLPQGNYTQCWNVTIPWYAPAYSGSGPEVPADLYSQMLPSGVPILVMWEGQAIGVRTVHAVPINPGVEYMSTTLTWNEPLGAAGGGLVDTLSWGTGAWNADGTEHTDNAGNSVGGGALPGATSPMTVTKPALNDTTDPLWWSFTVSNFDSIAHTGTVQFSFTCPPGVTYNACCAPDPLLEGEVQTILQYVQAIYAGLAIPPHSFAEATSWPGLTGNGSVTFANVPIAIKVTLTTIPAAIGVSIGDPNFYFDVGWLSFSTSEGNYRQQRLDLAEQLLTVPVLAGSVGYTLQNGVVATITELIPGP